jgi:hypothetical protein
MLVSPMEWRWISPSLTKPGEASMRMAASAVVVLPDPDSPMNPMRRPWGTDMETLVTAWTTPLEVGKSMDTFLMSRTVMDWLPPWLASRPGD